MEEANKGWLMIRIDLTYGKYHNHYLLIMKAVQKYTIKT